MKKRRLKKWVRYTLGVICLLATLVGVSECQDTKVFFISHGIALLVLLIFEPILIKDLLKEN
jgi:hypothetical protein